MTQTSTGNRFGIIGLVIGVLAISVAIFQDDLRPTPPSTTEQLKEGVISKGKEIFGIESPETRKRDYVRYGYLGFGLLALVLGVISYVRHENHRVSGLAGALGIVAIGWEYVMIGLIIAAVIFLLANLDFG